MTEATQKRIVGAIRGSVAIHIRSYSRSAPTVPGISGRPPEGASGRRLLGRNRFGAVSAGTPTHSWRRGPAGGAERRSADVVAEGEPGEEVLIPRLGSRIFVGGHRRSSSCRTSRECTVPSRDATGTVLMPTHRNCMPRGKMRSVSYTHLTLP